MSNTYAPLHNKYRPQSFDDLVGQKVIASTLKQALLTNRIAPAYLFCGPRGTGKTSSARILARSLNCLNVEEPTINPCCQCNLCQTISAGNALDVIEIDAASNTGVDNIRDLIEKSKFAPVIARWKIYVIDECHMLSAAAFNALLKTLEEPPSRVVFILATTDPQRLLPTIISRCQRFDFSQIELNDLINHLQEIANKEEIGIEKEAINLVARRSQGGLRDAQSMLDQLSLLPQPITVNAVLDLLGEVSEEKLLDLAMALTKKDPLNLLLICRELINNGKDPMGILQGLASILRDLVLKNAAPDYPDLCSISQESHQKLSEIASLVEPERLLQWQSHLKGSENNLRHSSQPRLWLEVLLLGLLNEPFNTKLETQVNAARANISYTSQERHEPSENPNKNNPNLENKNVADKHQSSLEKNVNVKETNSGLSEAWEQVLARIDLPSTRMLLSQQAQLVGLSENKAEINVAENWLGMIESRKSLLEKAINEALGQERKLILNSQSRLSVNTEKKIKVSDKHLKQTSTETAQDIKPKESPINNIDSSKFQSEKKDESNKFINGKAEEFAKFFNGEVINIDKKT
ncbi:DNA polymerase III subunit gamma/tau [Prochlorococcus marinus]|uniref:DNA polymerase III subunit gamma/tau n=1 Tax=Prochlorococcus marinus (strain MIT 9211) TaxID=93059 RepID=A9BDA2_PROM4|nr:DNA polymerase III subunit gamma/tau [Prochlorococcus marinus]ABX09715.1 DNA polymerase, gamma and tau subunits [Prochlorococcus marinus str. MIT 9211]